MTLLAVIILLLMILAVIIGAVQLAFWIIVLAIAYLCVCTVIEKVQEWLKS